jgi:rRNA maturation protein Nop10
MAGADAAAGAVATVGSRPPGRVTGCSWCGAAFDGREQRLEGRVRCPDCGAATTDPWPSGQELADAYGTWYRPESGRRFTFIGDGLLNRTRAALAARVDEIAPPGPVLDVGAGDGVLMDALKQRGREVVGLERDSGRADMRDEPIDRIDGEWAAVVFWHALEHLPDPGDAIRHAARLLKPGGIVLVAVPDTSSLQARAFGDGWLHLDLPRHLVHLSSRALRDGLEGAGLQVERESQIRGGQIVIGWLDGLVGSLPGDLDLYQALRRQTAQSRPFSTAQRLGSIAAGVVLLPVAMACGAVEVLLRRSGTVYVEARLPPGPAGA